MLSRRLIQAAAATPRGPASRAFSVSAAVADSKARVPSMADITPEQTPEFVARQKTFREQLVEAQKAREASALTQPQSPSSPRERHVEGMPQGLGSLNIAKGAHAEAAAKNPERKSGPLANLIYGTKEGREHDAQLEASFSQVLARGKYMHSIVKHSVKSDKVKEYTELVGKWYPRMASIPENKVHLVGSWRTEVGDCNTFVHIWEYQRYTGYHESRHAISRHPDFPKFDDKLMELIDTKHISLMQEFSFWPTTPPRSLGGVFELRSYTLHPGNLLEWEQHWRRGLKARREVMEGVGAWFVQIGDLNTVHFLWQFANLEERKVQREKSWSVEGWSDTVHKTVPLIQTMKSSILVPMPWSPVA